MQTTRTIKRYRWEDIGIDHSQYFQGRGVACTSYDAVYVGAGDDAQEALDDALDQAAYDGWDTSSVPDRAIRLGMGQESVSDDAEGELFYCVALYVSATARTSVQRG